jgi:hypothetical protein
MDEYNNFMRATEIHTKAEHRFYYLFSKSGFSETVTTRAQKEGVTLVNLEDLFLAMEA